MQETENWFTLASPGESLAITHFLRALPREQRPPTIYLAGQGDAAGRLPAWAFAILPAPRAPWSGMHYHFEMLALQEQPAGLHGDAAQALRICLAQLANRVQASSWITPFLPPDCEETSLLREAGFELISELSVFEVTYAVAASRLRRMAPACERWRGRQAVRIVSYEEVCDNPQLLDLYAASIGVVPTGHLVLTGSETAAADYSTSMVAMVDSECAGLMLVGLEDGIASIQAILLRERWWGSPLAGTLCCQLAAQLESRLEATESVRFEISTSNNRGLAFAAAFGSTPDPGPIRLRGRGIADA